MKKNLWFVFVALSVMAIFLVVGCKPTIPEPSPSPEPTPEPTPAPDTECPKVVSTVVSKAYDVNNNYNFRIVITFDEPVELSACAENPSNWDVTVENSDRVDDEISADVVDVSVDGEKVILLASVNESVSGSVYVIGAGYAQYSGDFEGLICSEEDADEYGALDEADEPDELAGTDLGEIDPPEYADEVSWSLDGCFIFDELGNGCCIYSGSDCCLEPVCEECVEGCPLGGGICQ